VRLQDMKIGARLALGFGIVSVLMVILIGVAWHRFGDVGEINHRMVSEDWRKAEAVAKIDTTMRANARRNLEFFIEEDPARLEFLFTQIANNKKAIDEGVAVLDELIHSDEGKTLLARFKDLRGKYVASFGRVGKLVREGARDDARELMKTETLPALDDVQQTITDLTTLQNHLVTDSGAMVSSNVKSAQAWMMGLGGAALFIGFICALLITRSVTRPMNEAVRIAQTVADGDLSSVIKVDRKDETGQLLAALKTMNDGLIRLVGDVRVTTQSIAVASREIASGNMDLSSRTEEQASSLEETASSMEELTSTVRQNADNARQANKLALDASEVAARGGQAVSEVVETMSSINDSSRKIVDIIGVIDSIAFQTNILALNAAVEAARAGEQGRGFAVVASEVRSLAQRSAGAAKEIKTLIGDSVERIRTGSTLVNQAGVTMKGVVDGIRRVTDIMGEISVASSEQTDGIEQIGQAVMQMDQVTQQNAALVEQAAAAADALQGQAAHLVQLVGMFRLAGDQVMVGSSMTPAISHVEKEPALMMNDRPLLTT